MTDVQTIAQRFMEALNHRDFETIAGFLDEDAALDTLTGQRAIGSHPLRLAMRAAVQKSATVTAR